MTSNFDGSNLLTGLTEEEYEDLARSLVRYIAFHATADQTTFFMNLWHAYTREIAARVEASSTRSRQLLPTPASDERHGSPGDVMRSAVKKPRSH